MASLETGEMFTEKQVQSMSIGTRAKLKLVGITSEEEKMLDGMNRKDRRAWLKTKKK